MGNTVQKSKKEIIANLLFYIALSIELLIVILDKSAYIIQYEGYWFRLTFVLFGLKILMTRYSVKEWVAIIFFGIIGAASYYITGKNEIVRLVVMVAACKEIDCKSLFRYIFYTTLAGCLILAGLSFAGVGIIEITRDFGRGMVQTRYCLGLGHPNALHCMFWALITLYLYCYKDTLKWFHFLILLVINHGMYILTDSRTGVIVTIFTIILAWILTGVKQLRYSKPLYIMAMAGIVGLFIFSVLLSNPDLYYKYFEGLDKLVTWRIRNTIYFFPEYQLQNWNLFGYTGEVAATDLGYVKLAFWYGIIPALIYVAMCCLLVWTAFKEKDYMAAVLVVAISVYTLFEGHEISDYHGRNYIYFLWGIYWSKMLGTVSEKERYLWELIPKMK